MSRSLKKIPFVPHYLLLKKDKLKSNLNTVTKIYNRSTTIIPDFIGLSFLVYNGKAFIPVKVSEDMVGHKFGEFALTRKQPKHSVEKKGGSK